MALYRVNIREMVEKSMLVEADTKEKAFTGIREKFENGEITLDKEADTYTFSMYGDKIKNKNSGTTTEKTESENTN